MEVPVEISVIEDQVYPLEMLDEGASKFWGGGIDVGNVRVAVGAVEDGLPTGLPVGVGKPADETVTPFPVGLGAFTELPPGDCGAWEDCAPGAVVGKPPETVVGNVEAGESEEWVCEDCAVT